MIYLKKLFKFLSSVKLAVPIMLTLLVCSIAGTLLESQYNAEYAALKIYKTWWFFIILILLWINILFAALSRIPWKKRHLGFLVTHLGMLLLLLGSMFTMVWGIDGTMQIYENSESNVVFLQNNVLEIDGHKQDIKRYLEKRDLKDAFSLNSNALSLGEYLPYVAVSEKNFDRGLNLNFRIKSAFFDVAQTLNTDMERQVEMGPAIFKLVEQASTPVREEAKNIKTKKTKGNHLLVKDQAGALLKTLAFDKERSFDVNGVQVKIMKLFKNAQIINNKIAEGDGGGSNPAIELQVTKKGESIREIIYQNIPEFTLHPDGIFGYKFSLQLELAGESSPGMPAHHPPLQERAKNTVEFKLLENEQVAVSLYKDQQQVMTQVLKRGETLTTPWMGMELTFTGLEEATANARPTEVLPQKKMPLPPSAIALRTSDHKTTWVVENSEQQVQSAEKISTVYYGKERLFLPFAIALTKFEKNDYPGSDMAMDYKSYVKINGRGPTLEIYMNEPLKMEGYTFYQSSYQITPNAPAVTILSVNRDPGREWKYLGSLILCLGIILYTLQKSERFKSKFNL